MSSSLVITIKAEESQAQTQQEYQLDSTDPQSEALALSSYFRKLASGHARASVDVQTGSAAPVAASGTFTIASAIATDAFVIGPTTFTFTSSPSLSTDVEVDGADDTADAAAAAAAINAHATVSQVVTATSALGVVTVTAKQKGVSGNFINISSPDATITASAANLAGGTGGSAEAAVAYDLGIS